MNELPDYSAMGFEIEGYRVKIHAWSNVIYVVISFSVVVFLGLSAFLYVDINVSSPGVIRPVAEISQVRTMVGGRIKELLIAENKPVSKGDILYSIESDSHEVREKYLYEKGMELRGLIKDLHTLIEPEINLHKLTTPLYRQAGVTYQKQLLEAMSRYKKAKVDFERNQYLHKEGVIADVEFEDFDFKRNQAELAIALMKETQMSQWQSQLNSYEVELMRIEADAGQLEKDKNNLIVRSPVTGTVQSMAGIYSGSFVYPNQELALISPDTSLIIEVFVTPYDIGLLQYGMPVKFQIDAFSYSQWGLASGKILEVSNDVHMIDERPVFKVQCSLDNSYLELKNGYRGYLKKGMTLRARFLVAQRTLYQLLYDKVEDWIDPNAVNHNIPALR